MRNNNKCKQVAYTDDIMVGYFSKRFTMEDCEYPKNRQKLVVLPKFDNFFGQISHKSL